jgi:hypothetical protein
MSRLTGTPVRIAHEHELEFFDGLSERAVGKINDIFTESDNRHKQVNARHEQVNELIDKLRQERDDLGQIRDPARRQRREKSIAAIQQQINKLNSGAAIPYPNADELNDWIGRNFRKKFEDYVPKIKEPENPKAALKEIRLHIDELEGQRLEAENAPLPRAMAEERIIHSISNLAASGAPDFNGPFRYDFISHRSQARAQGDVRWPETNVLTGATVTPVPNGLALCAWLFKDQLIAKAREEIAKLQRDYEALSPQQRAETVAKLDAKILELERQEEVIREFADVPRRSQNAFTERAPNMLAILGLREV